MEKILTITLNPAVDISSDADLVGPVHKVRTSQQAHDPGGGGINVARVIATLGADVDALYLAGGAIGQHLHRMLEGRGINRHMIEIAGTTRTSFNVFERQTGFEYRFVPQGPAITRDEVNQCLAFLAHHKADYVVVSGSVPHGAPDDILARMAELATQNGARVVVDSSGPALLSALKGGNVFLAKPSLRELGQIAGQQLDETSAGDVARDIIGRHTCQALAITLGAQGAMLARADKVLRLPARHVTTRSAVGAGDSFLGAMVWALAAGWKLEKAFRFGIAAGAAAALTPGTQLCTKQDVERLFNDPDETNGAA